MKIDDFDYNLPEELIAQKPADRRDSSRLLVVHRKTDTIEHKHFYDILDYLQEGDCLTLKDLAVSGRDLIAAGMKPGPHMGRVLEGLLQLVLEEPACNTREYLLSQVDLENGVLRSH